MSLRMLSYVLMSLKVVRMLLYVLMGSKVVS